MGGFGPSTGRTGEVCESSEMRFRWATRTMPPVAPILAFAAAFLGFVFGATLVYEDEEMLGAVLLIVAVTLVVLPVIWTVRSRR